MARVNIAEANDTNVILRYLLGLRGDTVASPSDKQAKEAAVRLADRANKATLATITGKQVTEAWSDVEVCPARMDVS